jgi:hypothetical protein
VGRTIDTGSEIGSLPQNYLCPVSIAAPAECDLARTTAIVMPMRALLAAGERGGPVWLVERFLQANSGRFTDVRWETAGYVAIGRQRGPHGANRNYFARKRSGLFRQTPSLADDPNNDRRLTNGWYVNLNLNTKENFGILCRFAAVAGFEYGSDWDWEVLDPTEEFQDRRKLATELAEELDALRNAKPATGT